MALITSFSTLKTALQGWMNRTDVTDADLEGYVQMGEARINRLVRIKEMEATASLTTDSDGTGALPTGFLQMKAVYDADNAIVPQVAPVALIQTPTNGTKVYTLMGGELALAPAAAETLTLVYYKAPTALTSSNTTNWLLTKFPDLYLYACLTAWSAFIEDDAGIAKWDAAFGRTMAEIQSTERRDRYSGPLAASIPVAQVRGFRA